MIFIIYIDQKTGSIISYNPQDEDPTVRIGDIINMNETEYSVISVDSEEFIDYGFILYKIGLSASEGGNLNGLY